MVCMHSEKTMPVCAWNQQPDTNQYQSFVHIGFSFLLLFKRTPYLWFPRASQMSWVSELLYMNHIYSFIPNFYGKRNASPYLGEWCTALQTQDKSQVYAHFFNSSKQCCENIICSISLVEALKNAKDNRVWHKIVFYMPAWCVVCSLKKMRKIWSIRTKHYQQLNINSCP